MGGLPVKSSLKVENLAWYVLFTAPRGEREVIQAIQRDLRAETFVPMRREKLRRKGRKRTALRLAFPRYVFLGVDGDPDRCWFKLRQIRGVQSVLSNEGRPVRLAVDLVAKLIAAANTGMFDKPAEARPHAPGDDVRIVDGPFASFCGKVANFDGEEERVQVFLTLFGREFPAWLELDQVETVRRAA